MFERFKHVKVQIHDSSFLRTIPVACVKKYLEQHNWNIHGEIKMNGECKGWIYEKEEVFVTVPKSEDYADYSLRLSELLKRTSEIEEGNQLSIVEEMFSFVNK